MELTDPDLGVLERARRLGDLPETFEVGQVFERVPMLCRDGCRMDGLYGSDHSMVEIVAVPGGRRRMLSYVKVDPQRGGNGRRDHQVHRIWPGVFARHYATLDAVVIKGTSMGMSITSRTRYRMMTGKDARP